MDLSVTVPSVPAEATHDVLVQLKECQAENDRLKGIVQEAESRLQSLMEKMNEENTRTNQLLTKKNDQIDLMRVKLNRYEFAIKEAVLFLGKPMETYNNWLQTGNAVSDQARMRNASAPVGQTPAQLAIIQQRKAELMKPAPITESMSAVDVNAPKKTISNDDIPNLECIRLALNYLRNAQASIQSMKGVSSSTDNMKQIETEIGRLNTHTIDSQESPAELAKSLVKLDVVTEEEPESIQPNVVEDAVSMENISSSSTDCEDCKKLTDYIKRHRKEAAMVKNELLIMKSQLEEEKGARERIQLSKDILDQELEELTAQLFDQANKMVIDEARMRDQLENANHELQSEWKKLLKKIENREGELNDLKRYLVALEAMKQKSAGIVSSPRSSNLNIPSTPSQVISDSVKLHQGNGKHSILSSRLGPNNTLIPFIPVDGILSSEFQDHIKAINLVANQPLNQALTVLMSTTFMKRCLFEDIEPCLLYAYQNSGATFKNATPVPSAFRKRVYEAVIRGGVEIHLYWSSREDLYLGLEGDATSSPSSIGTASSGSTSSPARATLPSKAPLDLNPPKKRCSGCGLTKECDYRMRFTNLEKTSNSAPLYSEWFPVCRFCRDRVNCVADFFAYMTQLRSGLVGKGVSILAMFKHTMWLRRRISVARLGGCALLESDFMGGDWEKLVQIIH